MKNTAQDLLDIKELLEKKNQKIQRWKGQRELYKEQLLVQFNCKTIQKAKAKLQKLETEKQVKENRFNILLNRFKKKYDF